MPNQTTKTLAYSVTLKAQAIDQMDAAIKRMQPTIPAFLKPLAGYPGAVIESLDALGSNARVSWLPDQRRTIHISGCDLTSDQLRQIADMMDASK